MVVAGHWADHFSRKWSFWEWSENKIHCVEKSYVLRNFTEPWLGGKMFLIFSGFTLRHYALTFLQSWQSWVMFQWKMASVYKFETYKNMAPHWSQLEFHGSTHDSICRIEKICRIAEIHAEPLIPVKFMAFPGLFFRWRCTSRRTTSAGAMTSRSTRTWRCESSRCGLRGRKSAKSVGIIALKKNGIIRDWMDIEWILNGIFQYHGNQPKDPWIWMVLIPADPQHESQGCCNAPAVRKLNCLIWLPEAFSGTLWHWAGIYAESTRKWGGTGQDWKLFGCDLADPCSLRCKTRRFEIRCSRFSSKPLPRTPMSA